jgi:hypothetical protein
MESPLSLEKTRAWLADAREQLSARPLPLTIRGPFGENISVANQGAFAILPSAFVERSVDRQFVPLELTVAPGVVVPLAEARIYYRA